MLDSHAVPKPTPSSLMPRTVIAVLVLIAGGAAADVVAGGLSGLTLFGFRWDESDGRNLHVPAFSELVLRICFWHNLVWFVLRSVLAFLIGRRSRAARVAAIVVEAGAVAVWIPIFFITIDGSPALVEDSGLGMTRVAAAVCIGVSIAAITLLCLPAVRSWCTRR